MNISKLIILTSLFFSWGCGEKELSPIEFVQWVENPKNRLLVEEQIENYRFKLQYQPAEYLVVNELREEELKKEVLEKSMKNKEGLQYYTLKMSMNNSAVFSGKLIQDSVLNHLNYHMKDDFYLMEGEDTLSCKLFHYENTNGLTPYDAFVLGFES